MTTEELVSESIRDRRTFDLVFEDGTVVKVEHRGGDRP
nr:MAG TPA: Large polyvalent protein associated domain 30 [Caudoviricetes sp.]